MISAGAFFEPARARGFDFYTGVPCSFLTPLLNRAIAAPGVRYVGAASEGEAVAIAAGAWLTGRRTVVMCQNSGLGNCVNPLTSLSRPFRIPTLLVTTWRGEPGIADEPQHEWMGRTTQALLGVLGLGHAPFPADEAAIAPALEAAEKAMDETGLPFALVMAKGSVADEPLREAPPVARPRGERRDLRRGGAPPARAAALERVLAAVPETAALVATTGKCGRELFTLADRPQHFYQVGSMGCAAPLALGVALCCERPVLVLDGDGAALMKLGAWATIGAQAPANLVHVLLDNASHDSTGGQATASPNLEFERIALACGYRTASCCDDPAGLDAALAAALREPGPHLVHVRIAPGSLARLGRPTVAPADVARRFKTFLAS